MATLLKKIRTHIIGIAMGAYITATVLGGGIAGHFLPHEVTAEQVKEQARSGSYNSPDSLRNFYRADRGLKQIEKVLEDSFVSKEEVFGEKPFHYTNSSFDMRNLQQGAFNKFDGNNNLYWDVREVTEQDYYPEKIRDLVQRAGNALCEQQEIISRLQKDVEDAERISNNPALSPEERKPFADFVKYTIQKYFGMRVGVRGDSELYIELDKTVREYRAFLKNLEKTGKLDEFAKEKALEITEENNLSYPILVGFLSPTLLALFPWLIYSTHKQEKEEKEESESEGDRR